MAGCQSPMRGWAARGEAMLVLACGATALVAFGGILPLLAGWR